MPGRAPFAPIIALALMFLMLGLRVPASVAGPPGRFALVVLATRDTAGFTRTVSDLRSSGGRPLHLFPPSALIATIPDGTGVEAGLQLDSAEIVMDAVPQSYREKLDYPGRMAVEVWNRLYVGHSDEDILSDVPEPPQDDAVEAPVASVALESAGESGLGCPPGGQASMVSEFMLGAISLNIILPQSSGITDPISENWDEAREGLVLAGIVSGAQWLLDRAPQSPPSVAISFTYHLYSGRLDPRASVSCEPISRPADPVHEPGNGEGFWTNQILDALGYATLSDRWVKARAFDDDTRKADGTDWCSTAFVVDSLKDADGRFADGRFAYTWQPGSHIVMTYDNSGWGIGRFASVFAHELCHAFWARDEYAGSGCSCTQASGYLDGPNQNCASSCANTFPTCVMRSADLSGGAGVVCPHTAKQIGWADQEEDGVPDCVQAPPALQLDVPSILSGNVLLSGAVEVQAAPNRNPSPLAYACPITLARVARVEASVDGGAWIEVDPAGGAFFQSGLNFVFASGGLTPGTHTITVQAGDTVGQVREVTATVEIPGFASPPPIPDGRRVGTVPMLTSTQPGNTLTLSWDASCPPTSVSLCYGFGSGLPTSLGQPLTASGAVCGIGATGFFSWYDCPDPSSDPTRFLWWLLVGTNGAGTEGSLGQDSSGEERNAGQASGLCGTFIKNTSNPGCGD
jgi:hypothetical protein